MNKLIPTIVVLSVMGPTGGEVHAGPSGNRVRHTSKTGYGSAREAATHVAAHAITGHVKQGSRLARAVSAEMLTATRIGESRGRRALHYLVETNDASPYTARVKISVRWTAGRGWIGYTRARPIFPKVKR